jgi:hypothetical protein
MDEGILDLSCAQCKTRVDFLPTIIKFQGQEIYLFHPIFCKNCLSSICKQHSTICANCGQSIPPYSQVGVLKGNDRKNQLVHMTTSCLTTGSAFHGYWGKGELHKFVEIEAC